MRIHNYLQIFRSMKLAAPDRIHVFEAAGPERLDHILSFVWLAWADHPPVGSLPLVASLPTAHDGEKKTKKEKKRGYRREKMIVRRVPPEAEFHGLGWNTTASTRVSPLSPLSFLPAPRPLALVIPVTAALLSPQ